MSCVCYGYPTAVSTGVCGKVFHDFYCLSVCLCMGSLPESRDQAPVCHHYVTCPAAPLCKHSPPGKGRGVSAPLYTASPPMYAWGMVFKLQLTLIVYISTYYDRGLNSGRLIAKGILYHYTSLL